MKLKNLAVKYIFKIFLAVFVIYTSYSSLFGQRKNPIFQGLFYLLSASAFWLLLNYTWGAISRKIYDFRLVRSIDQFCFTSTFGFVGILILSFIAYNVILILLPPNITLVFVYLLLVLFMLFQLLLSYSLGEAFLELKVQSMRQRWFCWGIGSFFTIVYPVLQISGTLIFFYFGSNHDFYCDYPWVVYILFGLENYVLIFILLCIEFF